MAKYALEVDTWRRQSWMTDGQNQLASRSIFEIAIPGTHNSGVFSPRNTIFVRNQRRDILEQLNGGIRSLDLRVRPLGPNYVFYHGIEEYPAQDFETALGQISNFVRNTKEIVIIRLRTYGFGEEKHFTELVNRWLKPHLIPKPVASQDFLIGNLLKHGNIILLAQNYWGLDKLDKWPQDDVLSSYSLKNPTQLYSGTFDDALADMELAIASRPRVGDRWEKFGLLDFGIWTTNNSAIGSYAADAMLKLITNSVVNLKATHDQRLTGGMSAMKPGINQSINIIQCDFFDYGSESYLNTPMVRHILILNDPRIRDRMNTYCDRPNIALAGEILDAWS